MARNLASAVLAVAMGVGLAGCGGGGGGDAPPPSAAAPTPPASSTGSGTPAGGGTATAQASRWSDPATWGGQVPAAGANVSIPEGRTVLLDTDVSVGSLTIEGELQFEDKPLALSAREVHVSGTWRIGSPAQPRQHLATITLTGARPADGGGGGMHGTRGINLHGGTLAWHGAAPATPWTVLGEHLEEGASQLTLSQTVDWAPGSQIVVGPSDWYGVDASEPNTVAARQGGVITLGQPSARFRWGRLQYVTANGMSLQPDPSFQPPEAPAPTVLDQRAPVAHLSRRIVVQGADDADWRDHGFGAHVMVMELSSQVVVDGVEFRRVGQAGLLGRYPFHWHMLSYNPTTGAELGDATGHVIRNSTVWNSANRCIVVHGTNGVRVERNICYDIRGHAFFLEDAVERRNVFERNLALRVRAPSAQRRLQHHEGPVFQGGPSGFWLTNPDNTVRHNRAADTEGNGFWLAFPERPVGLSKAVPLRPIHMRHGVFEHNTAHTTREPGVHMDSVPVDDAGRVEPRKYIPTIDGEPDPNFVPARRLRVELKRVTVFKSNNGAYRNRVTAPDYPEWVLADNVGIYMAGAGDDGVISRGLFVGRSLNNRVPNPPGDVAPPAAFATYHSTFSMRMNTVVNFPFVAGQPSGAFATGDYYTEALEKATVLNVGNRLIQSSPGYRVLPPHLRPVQDPQQHWTLAGALWDPHGYWGTAGNFWVFDLPFLTAGGGCLPVAPAGQNGASCSGQYYGVRLVPNNGPEFFLSWPMATVPFDVQRHDCSGTGAVGRPGEQCRWVIGDGLQSHQLGHMRHFTARNGGRYSIRFPSTAQRPLALPTEVRGTISNAFRDSDEFMLGIEFDGSRTATGVISVVEARWAHGAQRRELRAAASFDEVLQSAQGDLMWQDRENHLVWVKIKGGGLTWPAPSLPPANIQPPLMSDLFNEMHLLLRAQQP